MQFSAVKKEYVDGIRVEPRWFNALDEEETEIAMSGMDYWGPLKDEEREYWLETEAPKSVRVRIDRDFRPKKLGMRRDQLNMDRSNYREIRFYGHGRRAPERSWKSQGRAQKQYALRKFDKPGSSGFRRLVPLGASFYYGYWGMRDKQSLTQRKFFNPGPGYSRTRSKVDLLSRDFMSESDRRRLFWSITDRERDVHEFGPDYPMISQSVFDILDLDPELFLAKPHNLIPVDPIMRDCAVGDCTMTYHDYDFADL